jgi:transposase
LAEYHDYFPNAAFATALTRIPALLEDAEAPRPDLVRHAVWLLLEEAPAIEARLAAIDQQLAQIARTHPIARRLQQIPGIGVLTSTALVGAVNHIHTFRRGRRTGAEPDRNRYIAC